VSATRREVLGALAAVAAPVHAAPAPLRLYASGYAREGSPGLLPLGFDAVGERWQEGAPFTGLRDASFGTWSPRFGLHYLVEEARDGTLAAVRRRGGEWEVVARLPTGGADPCHLALDPRQSMLAVANYSGGNVAVFRLDPSTGRPLPDPVIRAHVGSGSNQQRQLSPHAHWVGFSPDGRWLWAVDLGADAVFGYPVDPGTIGERTVAFRAEPGAGPRHLALHPRRPQAFLLNELANSVTALRVEGGRFRAIATVPTLPPGFTGASTAAEIVVNAAGTHVYASNRGHDSVAVFALASDGVPRLIQHVGCGGSRPRYMRLLDAERRLLVANMTSGNVATFRVERDGRLTPHGPGVKAPGVTYLGLER
jgi:6-phosphogluconolactonase